LTTAILWIHATAGALWIGACACFVIAALALTPGTNEHRNFVVRSAPKIDRLAMLAAGVLFLTGLLNLVQAEISRQAALSNPFSTAFITVLAIKILLFIAMVSVMHWSMRIAAVIRTVIERGTTDALPSSLNRMLNAHAAVVAMGSIALLLGLWLIGS
jgi:hypothetical protein